MRPLRLLLSLSSCLIAITLLLYITLGSGSQDDLQTSAGQAERSKLKALFSFTSPGSLFPPSAIISLTDDNSTFFLARPAAFGPLLPSKGLSSPLWIGSGFGDDTLGKGELGCSDVPGWNEGDLIASEPKSSLKSETGGDSAHVGESPKNRARAQSGDAIEEADALGEGDGTDDYLHLPLAALEPTRPNSGKKAEHADIQSLQESAEIAGKVVLLKRGGCGFLEKVKWAQRRGGIALIVGDDVRGGALVRMYAHGDTSNITIPALFTSHTTAHLLSSLLPSDGSARYLSSEDASQSSSIKPSKEAQSVTPNTAAGKKQNNADRPTFTQGLPIGVPTGTTSNEVKSAEDAGWFKSFLYALGFGYPGRTTTEGESRRPPSSGNLDWVLVEDWDEDLPTLKPTQTKEAKNKVSTAAAAAASDTFVIGEQDWRDPDLLPLPTSFQARSKPSTKPAEETARALEGGSVLPGSGEYSRHESAAKQRKGSRKSGGWLSSWFAGSEEAAESEPKWTDETDAMFSKKLPSARPQADGDESSRLPLHEGLWVTLTPTTMSSSPFIDTLLVLVVSPLVTLTVVYALLLLRSRIRRRRWRAPKSVVERLPVRTYHTISDVSSSPSATPATSSSPTTPLLQHTQSRPTSSPSRPRSRTDSEVPATSSSFQQQGGRTPEEEKREAGLAEWRRRYGGRQKECVVCLEEYVDGVSRVMSLPCGHEFHEDCITPWLVTRRRTCPICKGDVVRSLSQSYRDRSNDSPSPVRSPRFFDEEPDPLQAEAAETRNDSPSASLPVPVPSSSAGFPNPLEADIEANWDNHNDDDAEMQGREIPHTRISDLSGSMRDLSSTVTTTIWRGVDVIRGATGIPRRRSREEVDRDR